MDENAAKRRQSRSLLRKKPKREQYPRVLIVCEGESTEPNYFNEIRKVYGIASSHLVALQSGLGTSPRNVTEGAVEEFKRRDRRFEYVYAVFDRDDHYGFHEAADWFEAQNGKHRNENGDMVKLSAVTSIPCFELWLLLHFTPVTADMHRKDVYHRLKVVLQGYDKGQKGHFDKTRHLLDAAFANAGRLRKLKAKAQSRDFPSTDVDLLVSFLTNIRKQP